MKKYEFMQLKSYNDPRGSLISFERGTNCPFDVRRCFFIYDTKGSDVIRGAHANRYSKFLLVVMKGSCRVKIDTGDFTDEVLLNNPDQALYLDKLVWKEMFEFSDDSVLMVLSNEMYDENEYIRDYEEFLREIKK